MLAISGLGVVFLAGVSMRFFIAGIALAIAAVPVVWNYLFEYQKERVLVFLDPERDPLGAGYHIIQSKIGIGSGGFFGKGLAQGTQSQLKFLPERHTDFVFAIYAEELGFVGSLLLIFLFAVLIFLMFNIAVANAASLLATDHFRICICLVDLCYRQSGHGYGACAGGWCAATLYFLWGDVSAGFYGRFGHHFSDGTPANGGFAEIGDKNV